MLCRKAKLTLLFATLSLSSCAGLERPRVDDTFCVLYRKVIVDRGDGTISAKPEVKKRLLANELLYREQCNKN